MVKIILQSSDAKNFPVELEVAKKSNLIKEMLDNLGVSEGVTEELIPVPSVRGDILEKVVVWAQYHLNDPPPPEASEDDEDLPRSTDDICDWDLEFLKVDNPTLFDLIIAANYLDIKGLLDVACKSLAKMFKNKTVEEIRETFNLTNDFTPEEEEQIRKENEWCAEK